MIPDNACPPRITAAAGTRLAWASSEGTVKSTGYWPADPSSPLTAVYTPKGFIPHAASLGQGFPHCPNFKPAASRRSGARVSVPLGPVTLSGRLPVIGLVGHYPTNYLIGRGPLLRREHTERGPLSSQRDVPSRQYAVLAGVSPSYPPPKDRLATRYSAVRRSTHSPKGAFAHDLHG